MLNKLCEAFPQFSVFSFQNGDEKGKISPSKNRSNLHKKKDFKGFNPRKKRQNYI